MKAFGESINDFLIFLSSLEGSRLTLQTCKIVQMQLQNNFGPIAKYPVDGGTFIMKHNLEQIVSWHL